MPISRYLESRWVGWCALWAAVGLGGSVMGLQVEGERKSNAGRHRMLRWSRGEEAVE